MEFLGASVSSGSCIPVNKCWLHQQCMDSEGKEDEIPIWELKSYVDDM